MIYKDFKGLKLSALGMGTMRLPVIDGDVSKIDIKQTEEMVDYAIKNGINYFDTAWGYHYENSESVIGQVLSKYNRDSFYLATKFPGYDMAYMKKIAETFETQLKKCKVDYFDFYLLHCVDDYNIDNYLNKDIGSVEYFIEQRKLGRVKHLGFSVHSSYETFERFLKAYGKEMEFCQVQLNYIDFTYQEANKKLELLKEYDIPVWVMEPLRGGKIASLPNSYMNKLKEYRDESAPAWGFRWLQTIPEVTMILSGMSNFGQLKENIEIFEKDSPLKIEELNVIGDIAKDIINNTYFFCTGCKYCLKYCAKEIDIPYFLKYYNDKLFNNEELLLSDFESLDETKLPTSCIGCKKCEKVCPQTIKISKVFNKIKESIK